MPRRRSRIAGLATALLMLATGLVATVRGGTLDVAQGADAPAYVRIARVFLATGGVELPAPGDLRPAHQERLDDVFGSPVSMTVDGRYLPKHPVLFGALLVPGVAVAGVAGARVTALLLGSLLAGVAAATAARRYGVVPSVVASCAVLLFSPAGRNVLWAINVDTAIALVWLGALLLADSGRPLGAGLLGGALLFLRPPALVLLSGAALLVAVREGRGLLRFAAGVLPSIAALAAVNTVLWGAPWGSSYDRVAVVRDGTEALLGHSDQFTLPPLRGLALLLLDDGGGLLATAPACLVGLLGLLLPAGRDRLGVAAAASASAFLLLISGYAFLALLPATTYRFALPLLVASVLPLAALVRAALDLRRRPRERGVRAEPDEPAPGEGAGR